MRYNRVCDEDDWDDPALQQIMIGELHLPPDIGEKRERKHWEWALGFHALKNYGFLNREIGRAHV